MKQLIPSSERPPGVAVVTGGTLGIGEEITRILLANDWAVHLLSRHAASSAFATDSRCYSYDVDVCNVQAVHDAAYMVAKRIGESRIDCLVLCAGVGYETPIEKVSHDQYRELMDTNFGGVLFSVKSFLPLLQERDGVIVVMSSIAGRRGFANWSLYCATKHALEGMVSSLRQELRPQGIRVTSIQPGSVDTPSYAHLDAAEKIHFMQPKTIAELTVHAMLLPREASVETMFINNSVGDL